MISMLSFLCEKAGTEKLKNILLLDFFFFFIIALCYLSVQYMLA